MLYSYPQVGTKGCTTETCVIRDNCEAFVDADVQVIRASKDSVKNNTAFAEAEDLPFPLW